jgi:Zn-dependent protease/predicted transcriptional regulator
VAHVLVARRLGIRTLEIIIYPIGGVARLEKDPEPKHDFWIALAGPMLNIAIGTATVAWLWKTGGVAALERLFSAEASILARIGAANLAIGLFNLLPAFPMDGGRIFRAVLAGSRAPLRATRMAAGIGRLIALLLGGYGIVESNFFLVLIAVFIYIGAAQESASALGRELTQGVPVKAAMMTDYRTLSHGNSIRDAADLLLATAQQDFPVVLGDQVIGLLGRNALMRGLAREGPDSYVAGLMDRTFTAVSPDMDLAEALPLLGHSGACALVMQEERLLGLLTRENLSEFLMLRRLGLTLS